MIRMLAFLMVSVVAVGTSLAENTPQACPPGVDTLPIQLRPLSSGRVGEVTTFSKADIRDSPSGFAAFVTAVAEHLTARLDEEKLCLGSAESQEQSLVQFVPYMVADTYRSPVPTLEARPVGVCRITSPWIDLAIERAPVPRVRAIVRYSDRQMLADQAVLAGVPNVPPGTALPIKHKEYFEYMREYEISEVIRVPVAKPIEERVPPDFLWLFRRSSSGAHFVETTDDAMNKVREASTAGYTKIAIALVDHCFASGGADIQYNSILDVADLVPLDQYKVVPVQPD